jgi:hypothetical protein
MTYPEDYEFIEAGPRLAIDLSLIIVAQPQPWQAFANP